MLFRYDWVFYLEVGVRKLKIERATIEKKGLKNDILAHCDKKDKNKAIIVLNIG